MIVLAVESATALAGVALCDEDGPLATATVSRGRRHAESVAPAVDFVCRRSGVALTDVDVVAVDVGPGLFTGLRVGVATAKALAFALGVGVVTASSLEVLAHAVTAAGVPEGRLVVSVVDARRGEVFTGWFRAGAGTVAAVDDDALLAPDALAARLGQAGEPVLVAGDGALRYGALLRSVAGVTVAGRAFASPPVDVLGALGVDRAIAGEVGAAADVVARYLRDADTRINWEQRAARRAGAGA